MSEQVDQSLKLSDGSTIPRLGLGCFAGDFAVTEEMKSSAEEAVKSAISAGYRHFDNSAIYDTETAVGRGVRAKIEDGTVKRQDVYITTKLGSNNHQPERVEPALRQSLKNLDMDYVDLYLIHFPIAFKGGDDNVPVDANGKILHDTEVDLMDTWKAMEACQKKGLAKSIGVSNFSVSQMQRVLDICEVKPVVNQVEVHPFCAQEKLVDFCQRNNVAVECFAVIGGPAKLGLPGMPDPKENPRVIGNGALEAIGQKYKKSAVQVALRFQLQRGLVVLPKSFNPVRQKENMEVFDFTLSHDDMKEISQLNMNHRYYKPIQDALFGGCKEYQMDAE